MELRCGGRIHGVVRAGVMEVKCHSKVCGKTSGVTVLHYFDLNTGQLLETRRFKDPVPLFSRPKETV